MAKKINLSERQKKFLKDNFSKVNTDSLSADRLRYYNLIRAGKARAKKAIRIEGKYLTGEITDIMRQVAKKKGMSVKEYAEANKAAILNLINTGSTETFVSIEKAIELISSAKAKYVYVDDGNGEVKMKKNEAIELLARFEQHVKSTTNTVMLSVLVTIFKNGRIKIVIPSGFEKISGEELINYMLGIDGIDFIESGDTEITKKVRVSRGSTSEIEVIAKKKVRKPKKKRKAIKRKPGKKRK